MRFLDSIMAFFAGWRKQNGQPKYWQTKEEPGWIRWVILGILVIVLVPMFPRGRSLQFADMTEGSISTRRIVAPFSFEILKTQEEIQVDRDLAAKKVYPVFSEEDRPANDLIQDVDTFFREVESARETLSRDPELLPALQDSLFRRYPISVLDTMYQIQLIDPTGMVEDRALRNFRNNIK